MKSPSGKFIFRRVLLLMLGAWPLLASAQGFGPGGGFGRGGRRGGFGGGDRAYVVRDPAEQAEMDQMQKALTPGFENDVFAFTRLIYSSTGYGRGSRFWEDDTPDADLNLGFRLFQVTSLKIHPGFNYIHITPQEMANYPLVYLAATDGMALTDDEVKTMREYMLNGGFVMAEDFWGDRSWSLVYATFKRIFPDRELQELPLSHPIFHSVFDFKYLAQMPSVGAYLRTGLPYDPADYSTDHDPHYYGIFDDKGHLMALICRNNHYGDGWEHEGDDHTYFDRFSMPQAYPMFINILFYVMTH